MNRSKIVQKSFNDCTIPVLNLVKYPSKSRHSDEIVDVNQPTIELMCAIYLPDPRYRGADQIISAQDDPIWNRAKIKQNTGNDCAIGMRDENSLTNIRISCMLSWCEAVQIRIIFDMVQNRSNREVLNGRL